MKITQWWWAVIWAGCAWIGSAISSEQGMRSPVGFGLLIGVAWGALVMRWNIKRSNVIYAGDNKGERK